MVGSSGSEAQGYRSCAGNVGSDHLTGLRLSNFQNNLPKQSKHLPMGSLNCGRDDSE